MEQTDNTHVRFYYLRSGWDEIPEGCVCLIRSDDNRFCRGISICNFSKGDRFLKQIARGIAFSRAIKAYEEMASGTLNKVLNADFSVLSEELDDKFKWIESEYGFDWKASPKKMEANVELTQGEKEMWRDHLDPNFVRKPRG